MITISSILTCELILAIAGEITAIIGDRRNNKKMAEIGLAVAQIGVLAIFATMSISDKSPKDALWMTLGILVIDIAVIIGYRKIQQWYLCR